MSLIIVAPPTVEPVTSDEVRARLGMTYDDFPDDLVIDSWITAARQKLDGPNGLLQRALITQTWSMVIDEFPPPYEYYGFDYRERGYYSAYTSPTYYRRWPIDIQAIRVPLPPLQAVTSITYLDGNGVTQTIDPSTYRVLLEEPGVIVPATGQSWPLAGYTVGSVTVRFRCGYGDTAVAVPEGIKTAIVLGVSELRSTMARDLFISSETVEGVGSTSYVAGSGLGTALGNAAKALLMPYMVQIGAS
jgi:hypothetical protein